MAQQGPPPPRPGRAPGGGPGRPWRDPGYGDPGYGEAGYGEDEHAGEEEYPPWAGPGVIPRYADHDERERRRLGEAAALRGRSAGSRERAARQAWRGPAEPGPEGSAAGSRAGRRARPPDSAGGEAGYGHGRGRQPGSRSVARAARLRRSRRLLWASTAAVALVVVAAAAAETLTRHPAASAGSGGLVTTYQPGELKAVPNACSSVSAATLGRYLPGRRRMVAPHSLFGRAQSLCNWSVDAPPMYRLLEVTVQAYAPSGLASGDGSATFAAIDAYQQALAAKAHPAKQTHLPKASITTVHGLGDESFMGLQVPSAGGATTDLVTVVARQRNVLVTVVFDGLTTSNHRYGHVSVARLRAGAIAAARDLLSHLS